MRRFLFLFIALAALPFAARSRNAAPGRTLDADGELATSAGVHRLRRGS